MHFFSLSEFHQGGMWMLNSATIVSRMKKMSVRFDFFFLVFHYFRWWRWFVFMSSAWWKPCRSATQPSSSRCTATPRFKKKALYKTTSRWFLTIFFFFFSQLIPMWLPMIQANLKVRNKRPLPSQSNDHTHNLLIQKHPSHPPCSSPASVCGTAAATAGHPEPGQPPVSAGSSSWRAAVCPAQVAPVHPVQDGSGGDPVVGSRLTVLPHVICSLLCSRHRFAWGPSNFVRLLWPRPPKPKKGWIIIGLG